MLVDLWKSIKHSRASWLWMSLLCSYQHWGFHQQKVPLRWVKTGWGVDEFVDVMKMWVKLFHFSWRWVKFVIFTQFLFQICRFYQLFFPVSPFCRFHLLLDFVFNQYFFPFHPLADFTYLLISPAWISSICTRLVLWLALSVFAYMSFSPTDSFHPLCHRNQFSPTMLRGLVSTTCRFHLVVDFTHLQISSTCNCLVSWWALSVFAYTSLSPTHSFHPLCHRN